MQHARWIVVGTDFSDGAQCALDHAVRLAGRSGARIALVHAYEDEAQSLRSSEDCTSTVRERLEDEVARAGANDNALRVETFVRRGAPWEKLSNVAVEVGADLIVVGATGQRGADAPGSMLGSVAYRVVASATRSVLISRLPFDKARGCVASHG